MIRIPLSQLEEVRSNPKEIANKLSGKETSYKGRYSKFQAWKYAAMNYHKSRTRDLDHAINTLKTSLKSNFKTFEKKPKELQKYADKLELYIEDHHKNNFHYIESIHKLELQISTNVIISGQIPIINMIDNDTYGIIFFTKGVTLWEQELKFPLLQYHFAKRQYKCDLSQIFVGVYCYELDKHYFQSFSQNAINHALSELNNIAEIIEKV